MRWTLTMLLLPLCCATLLAACASVPPAAGLRDLALPEPLLRCAPPPAVPNEAATQRDVALFILDLATAGEDCRAKLDELRGIVAARRQAIDAPDR